VREAEPRPAASAEDDATAEIRWPRPIFFATVIIIATDFPLFGFRRVEAKAVSIDGLYAEACAKSERCCLALTLVTGLAYLAL